MKRNIIGGCVETRDGRQDVFPPSNPDFVIFQEGEITILPSKASKCTGLPLSAAAAAAVYADALNAEADHRAAQSIGFRLISRDYFLN